jgi:hypothetical protein
MAASKKREFLSLNSSVAVDEFNCKGRSQEMLLCEDESIGAWRLTHHSIS